LEVFCTYQSTTSGNFSLGAIRKMPAVIETPEGDFIGIRQKMFLSHSYDHRVVDGALGGSFVKESLNT
jgi:2-oxoglutarate dehydrogenase E2 component (dihydrolipoamide succinyltransferase)